MTALLCLLLGHKCRCESYLSTTFDALTICRVWRWCERCGKEM